MAEYLEGEPARKRAAADAQKAKLEALEKKLGITPSSTDNAEASSSKPPPTAEADVSIGKKRRFDDTEYLEQSRELVDGVKSALVAGLKKRKKAKKSPDTAATTTTEKVVESAAAAAPIAAAGA